MLSTSFRLRNQRDIPKYAIIRLKLLLTFPMKYNVTIELYNTSESSENVFLNYLP